MTVFLEATYPWPHVVVVILIMFVGGWVSKKLFG